MRSPERALNAFKYGSFCVTSKHILIDAQWPMANLVVFEWLRLMAYALLPAPGL
jgi:hypothetical protein